MSIFLKILSFVVLSALMLVFLVFGSVQLIWTSADQPSALQIAFRLTSPLPPPRQQDKEPSISKLVSQTIRAAFGERDDTPLVEQLTHPQPNVNYDEPRYRVTFATVSRRLGSLFRVGPFLVVASDSGLRPDPSLAVSPPVTTLPPMTQPISSPVVQPLDPTPSPAKEQPLKPKAQPVPSPASTYSKGAM